MKVFNKKVLIYVGYFIALNIIITLALIAYKPVIEIVFNIIANIDENWLSHPFTFEEGGENSTHSPFYIIVSFVTIAGLLIGAWAYLKQAKALNKQASAMHEQMKEAKIVNIENRFSDAVIKISESQNSISRTAAFHELIYSYNADQDRFILRLNSIFSQSLTHFSAEL